MSSRTRILEPNRASLDMQQNCDMGLFPEIGRAWLTIDSNIYLWAYDNANDVAFYDKLTETIVSVGLMKPKPGKL